MLKTIGTTTVLALMLIGAAPRLSEPEVTYGDPTNITNPYAVFEPESVHVFSGRRQHARTVDVVRQFEETRVFNLAGVRVECRIFEQREFANGVLEEITTNYIAQDDAGNVRSFGEVSILFEDGVAVGLEEDSWLVGGAIQADDPAGVQIVDTPSMFMPADPQLGDVISLENHDGGAEQLTVVAVGVNVSTPAGNFSQAIIVKETHAGQRAGEGGAEEEPERPEYRWLVPGVGAVKEQAGDQRSVLIATSMQAVKQEAEVARR